MTRVTDLSNYHMPQLEFDCTICGERHFSGDQKYETHRLYRTGDERDHVHSWQKEESEYVCACGARSALPFL